MSEDHQTKHAQAVADKNAAILIKESELSNFQNQFDALLNDSILQQELGKNIKKLALPKATEHIVNEVEKLISN